jgi:hypothetical protein
MLFFAPLGHSGGLVRPDRMHCEGTVSRIERIPVDEAEKSLRCEDRRLGEKHARLRIAKETRANLHTTDDRDRR